MISASEALANIPNGLREPLLAEYESIVQNYLESKWRPSELSGGRFCEVVYTILVGHAGGTYPAAPAKPQNFVGACRSLENNAHVPRSFQILIPRMLPALYEVRNNRGVGHVGGDVDPCHMDATVVLGLVNWIMCELVRVFHNVDVDDAQRVVDLLAERRIPIVWQIGSIRRVLDTSLSLTNQILLLIASSPAAIVVSDLEIWVENKNSAYFRKTLRELHSARKVELSGDETEVQILPPGAKHVEDLIRRMKS